MKKLCFVFLILAISFSFTSCILDRSEYFAASQDPDQIECVNIYYVESLSDESPAGEPLDQAKSDDYADLIKNLETLYYEYGVLIIPPVPQDPNFNHYGYLIEIQYKNGNSDLLSRYHVTYLNNDKNGAIFGQCDKEAFHSIIEKYTDIDCSSPPNQNEQISE